MTIQELTQAVNMLRQQNQVALAEIALLKERVAVSEKNKCCCNSPLVRDRINFFYYDDEGNIKDQWFLLNDSFPTDINCIGAKAIMVLTDAVVLAEYVSIYNSDQPNSGWQVIASFPITR